MNREELTNNIINLKGDNWLLELATGTGKSKIALEKIKSLEKKNKNKEKSKLLVVIYRKVHKQNWEKEFHKWWPSCNLTIDFTTYASFPKISSNYNYAIFDECHHLSERCRKAVSKIHIGHSILLSATVSIRLKDKFNHIFKNLVSYKRDLRAVIEDEILPDPKIYLYPLDLNKTNITETIIKNSKAKGTPINCTFAERWNFKKEKSRPVIIHCTERQYLFDLDRQIDYWKKRYIYTNNNIAKNKYLRLCGDRLKWLSNKKVDIVKELLSSLKNYRTLTFCNSIEQTEYLGKYCINSKNDNSSEYIDKFNSGKINHITACNMLNEGMNLENCQIGIYANLNSSETIIKQRMGRLLRHPNPIIIVPYYINSREAELIKQMIEDYNPELITIINSIKDIKI